MWNSLVGLPTAGFVGSVWGCRQVGTARDLHTGASRHHTGLRRNHARARDVLSAVGTPQRYHGSMFTQTCAQALLTMRWCVLLVHGAHVNWDAVGTPAQGHFLLPSCLFVFFSMVERSEETVAFLLCCSYTLSDYFVVAQGLSRSSKLSESITNIPVRNKVHQTLPEHQCDKILNIKKHQKQTIHRKIRLMSHQ